MGIDCTKAEKSWKDYCKNYSIEGKASPEEKVFDWAVLVLGGPVDVVLFFAK